MYSAEVAQELTCAGFPIRKSPDQSLFSDSPKLNAAYHVLHRLLTPRHPPFALSSLATKLYYLYKRQNVERFVLSNLILILELVFFNSLIVKELKDHI